MTAQERSLSFWRGMFPGPIELPRLPYDRARSVVPLFLRDTAQYTIGSSLVESVREMSIRLEVPAFPIVVAAVQTVLFHYGNHETCIVGASTHDLGTLSKREAPYTAIVPIKADWSRSRHQSVQELVLDQAQVLGNATKHANFSLPELEALVGVKDLACGFRLFNVGLIEQLGSADEWPQMNLDHSDMSAKCDLVISCMLAEPKMTLMAEFDAELFNADTVQRFLGHIGVVLHHFTKTPSANAIPLSIVSEAERCTLIEIDEKDDEDTVSTSGTLHELFELQAERTPTAVAATCDGQSLTYGDLNQLANRAARRLIEAGVRPDMLVGLCMDRSNKLLVALLAILKAGGAYLPIDLVYPPDRLAFMLEDAQAQVLLTELKLKSNLPRTCTHVIYIEDLLCAQPQNDDNGNLSTGVRPDNLAYVIYTSGTTGLPKGSLISHKNVTRLFSSTAKWFRFNERDVWTLFHSTAFDFSVWEIWGAWIYGGKVVVVPFMTSRSPEEFYKLLVNERVTVLNQTPSAFRQLIQAEEARGAEALALRYVIFGGEALEMQSLRPWFERHGDQQPRLVNMYGITETTVHVTYRSLDMKDLESGSVIGIPIPDLRVHILNEFQQLVPIGIPGELYVGGAGLARGYLNRPELTAKRFLVDHLKRRPGARLYRTGDLARRLSNGDIEYLGRVDHQVKIRGFRIELGEIESVLSQYHAVQEATVVVREDEPGDKRLVAYIVSLDRTLRGKDIKEYLKRKLPEYMVPAAIVFLDKFPLTASGKIDRKALPIPESGHRYSTDSEASLAPQSDLERQLASIWAQALGLNKVGVEENFFELGGDSILIVQVHRKLREQLRFELPLVALFEYPTIRALASRLNESGSSVSVDDVEKQLLARASRQKEALAQMKAKRGTT